MSNKVVTDKELLAKSLEEIAHCHYQAGLCAAAAMRRRKGTPRYYRLVSSASQWQERARKIQELLLAEVKINSFQRLWKKISEALGTDTPAEQEVETTA